MSSIQRFSRPHGVEVGYPADGTVSGSASFGWRTFGIEDPFEVTRDLGSVLTDETFAITRAEVQRAAARLHENSNGRARREMLKSRYYDARRAESTEHTYGSYETCNVDSDRSTHLSLNIYIPCNVIFITDIKMTNRRRKE